MKLLRKIGAYLREVLDDRFLQSLTFALLFGAVFAMMLVTMELDQRENDPTRLFQSQEAGGVNAEEGPGPMEELTGGTKDPEQIPKNPIINGACAENDPEEMESVEIPYYCAVLEH